MSICVIKCSFDFFTFLFTLSLPSRSSVFYYLCYSDWIFFSKSHEKKDEIFCQSIENKISLFLPLIGDSLMISDFEHSYQFKRYQSIQSRTTVCKKMLLNTIFNWPFFFLFASVRSKYQYMAINSFLLFFAVVCSSFVSSISEEFT